ncbi:hypothetical protein VTK73DRAFT_2825 [Phialemonium thermophilum]|uniref:NAD-dependent epimerase/dehydratase domain-containing protein n=1 Tax=Phialemonium thermophilum TaxID=223376 RepID=A0ABR3X248_9PEZI
MRAVGAGFVVGRGLNRETFVHVRDLAEMYAALVNDARRQVRGGARDGESLWGLDAYYFGGDEELSFREFMETLLPLARARGIVSRDDIVSLGAGEPATLLSGSDAKGGTGGDQDRGAGRVEHEWSDHILVMFGINMRCRSVRARKLLGYVPRGESVAESLPATLDLFLRRAKAT